MFSNILFRNKITPVDQTLQKLNRDSIIKSMNKVTENYASIKEKFNINYKSILTNNEDPPNKLITYDNNPYSFSLYNNIFVYLSITGFVFYLYSNRK